jgi:hypothetical protein
MSTKKEVGYPLGTHSTSFFSSSEIAIHRSIRKGVPKYMNVRKVKMDFYGCINHRIYGSEPPRS